MLVTNKKFINQYQAYPKHPVCPNPGKYNEVSIGQVSQKAEGSVDLDVRNPVRDGLDTDYPLLNESRGI